MTAAKICGLTTPAALDAALDGGAAFVGAVVFPKSPRHIDPLHGATLFERARGKAKIVAVTVDADDALLTEIALILKPDLIQLHGEETPAFCRQFTDVAAIKVWRMRDASGLAGAAEYEVDALLLDTYTDALPGGTGQTFDWTLAVKAKQFGRPVILSGGLTPENVREAIATVQPYAVDVASGVESRPGRKDADKLRRFITACRNPSK
jgi:phosphoribosylanthranilate isomerase